MIIGCPGDEEFENVELFIVVDSFVDEVEEDGLLEEVIIGEKRFI